MGPTACAGERGAVVSMEDLLKRILGDADSEAPGRQAGADPLADLLRGILGGGAAAQAGRGQPSGTGLPDLLGGILGGGQGADGFGLDDILGGILGGGGANITANPFLAPIVQGLADKLGLSPAIAQTVVGFAISKLLPALLGAAGAQASGAPPRRTTKRRRGKTPAPADSLDLDHLLEQMGSGEALQPAYLRSTGMVEELTQQTGLEEDVALQSLQQVFGLFGAQMGRSEPPQPKSRLDHLLDTWED